MRGDIISGLVAVQMGGGGNVTVSDIHEVFKQQDILGNFELIGDYTVEIRQMPSDYIFTKVKGYSDWIFDDGSYTFAVSNVSEYNVYANGIYRKEEYLGLMELRQLSVRSESYSWNDTNTGTWLSKEYLTQYGTELTAGTASYNRTGGMQLYVSADRTAITNTYNEQGQVVDTQTVSDNIAIHGVNIGGSYWIRYPAVGADTCEAYMGEFMRITNAKYHEING